MWKLVVVLVLVLAVENYGIYGAAQAERPTINCTQKVGPLCFAWEENFLGKILGTEQSEELEDALKDAKEKMGETWDREVKERLEKSKDEGKSAQERLSEEALRTLDAFMKGPSKDAKTGEDEAQ